MKPDLVFENENGEWFFHESRTPNWESVYGPYDTKAIALFALKQKQCEECASESY